VMGVSLDQLLELVERDMARDLVEPEHNFDGPIK